MNIGFDLGTTFSCVSYISQNGQPEVIRNTEGDLTTPSILWFDGVKARVGRRANAMKESQPRNIVEFVKRDIGAPIEIQDELYDDDQDAPIPKPYEYNGFKFGAVGMSALILRKLKLDALYFFKQKKMVQSNLTEAEFKPVTVITVPAYFGEQERQATRIAGEAAGLNVVGIINEPTAAALAYGLAMECNMKMMVFDLGGGTFDVTVLEMKHGNAEVISSEGDNSLGGKDWDDLIINEIFDQFYKTSGIDVPPENGFLIQRKALEAKFALSEQEEVDVHIKLLSGDQLFLKLYRSAPDSETVDLDMLDIDEDEERPFYFEERAQTLLSRCSAICERARKKSGLEWSDLDAIILAGGSCRMPMIAKMLKKMAGTKIRTKIQGIDYDTAISIGAAYYSLEMNRVRDIISHSLGIKYEENGRNFIEQFLKKNSYLPAFTERKFLADENAVLYIYEGEEKRPEECRLRGRIELDNPEGTVGISMHLNKHGILQVSADYSPHGKKTAEIKHEGYFATGAAEYLEQLREKVQAVTIES